MFGCVWERKERESTQKLPIIFFFFFHNEGFVIIYIEKMTLQHSAHLVGPPAIATLLTSAILAFSQFEFGHLFEGLPGLVLS